MSQRLAVGVTVLFSVVLGCVIYLLVPARAPNFSDPSTLEAVFDSRFAITLARVLMLFGTVYAVVSVVALISRGQWLSSVGPFKVGESVRTLEQDQERLAQELDDAVETIEFLDGLLLEAQRELSDVHGELATLKEREVNPEESG